MLRHVVYASLLQFGVETASLKIPCSTAQGILALSD
jgi:hypothetical protein